MNKWELFETLKGSRTAATDDVKEIEQMNEIEIKEAVIEYILLQSRQEWS